MAQEKKSRSKGRQKSKAAQQTAQLKSQHDESTSDAQSSGPSTYKGGLMSNMRGGFQSAVGQGETKKKSSLLNNVLWIALIAAAVFMVVKQFQ
jgi:hypothetical protein